MMDPVQEARKKLIHIRFNLGSPEAKATVPVLPSPSSLAPIERQPPLANFLAKFIGAQIKRAVTLGVGVLVGAGYLSQVDGDAQGAALAAVLSQIALTVVYALYDKFLRDYVLARLGAKPVAK